LAVDSVSHTDFAAKISGTDIIFCGDSVRDVSLNLKRIRKGE
jgi:hypothetical protein